MIAADNSEQTGGIYEFMLRSISIADPAASPTSPEFVFKVSQGLHPRSTPAGNAVIQDDPAKTTLDLVLKQHGRPSFAHRTLVAFLDKDDCVYKLRMGRPPREAIIANGRWVDTYYLDDEQLRAASEWAAANGCRIRPATPDDDIQITSRDLIFCEDDHPAGMP